MTRIGPVSADGSGFVCKERTDREASFGAPARFRLLWKGPLLEFYLNDLLMHCYGMPRESTGRIGVIQGASHDAIRDVKAWR